MDRKISFSERKQKIIPAYIKKRMRGKAELMTKLAVIFSVLILGAALFLVCVYGILPSLISQVGDQMQIDLAKDYYQSTVEVEPAPAISAAAVFEQPEAETVRYPRECFASVRKDNPDIVGRITIEGLQITYLVTQSDNNSYYLKHGYDRSKSRSGAIFLDYRCIMDENPLKGHYVLYGHNMKNGSMFHNIKQYADEKTFYDNSMIRFDTLYEDFEWEVFSAYVTATDFNYIETSFADDAEWLKFVQQIQDRSLYKTDIKLSADDVVLTLSTCSYEFDNARFVVHARLVK